MARLRVEVIHATPERADVRVLELEEGATVGSALAAAGPVREIGAAMPRVRHSSAVSTTMGANSAVCELPDARSKASM